MPYFGNIIPVPGGPYIPLYQKGAPNGVMPLNPDGDAVGTMVQRYGTATQLRDVVLRRGEFATDGYNVRMGDDNNVWANLPRLGRVQSFSYTSIYNASLNSVVQSSSADLVIHSWTRNDDRWPPDSYSLEMALYPQLGQRVMLAYSHQYVQDTGGVLFNANEGYYSFILQGIDPTLGVWSWNKPGSWSNPVRARADMHASECAVIELLGIPGRIKTPTPYMADTYAPYIWQVTNLVNVQIGEAVE